MATSTTRLALTKPDTTDLVDIAVLNTNFNKIDAAAGAFVCTSTTRPSTPYNGQIIYETDTDGSLVWDSATSTWNILAPGVTICTSSSRPASPIPGQTIYETDTKLTFVYASGAWAPVVSEQSIVPFSEHTNYIINGGFDIWQRGTSFTAPTTAYTADRFQAPRVGFAVGHTVTRQSAGLTGFQYCLRTQRNSGNALTAQMYVGSNLETVNSITLAGKTVTLSFYARAGANYSAAGNALTAVIYTGTGTDQNVITGSFTGQVTAATNSLTLTTSWQRFSISGSLGSSITQVGVRFEGTPVGTAGANDYYEITGVQLEVGSIPSPFRRNANSIQGELAACQRYYYRAVAESTYGWYGVMSHSSTTLGLMAITLPVTMRTAPTLFESSAIGAFQYLGPTGTLSSLSLSSDGSSSRQIAVNVNGTGFTGASAGFLRANNNAAAFIGAGAEL